MLSIIKNDWYRMKEQKQYLFVALGLTICSVILAVMLTNKLEPKMNLAVIGNAPDITKNSRIEVTKFTEEPEMSQLIQGQYDAAVTFDEKGDYHIRTAKSDDFRKKLKSALTANSSGTEGKDDTRKIGTNIFGYMLMFLLMQGVLYARLFAEDKEKHQIERVVCSPISFWKYLSGHVIFIWSLIFLPSILMIAVTDLVGVSIGFALWQFTLLLGLLSFVSTCFAVCLNSFFYVTDTANMIGSCTVVMTSVLSGSFYDMGNSGGWVLGLQYVLPQKNLMVFADSWEKHLLDRGSITGLVYVIILTVVFLAIGIVKTRKDYIYHRSR